VIEESFIMEAGDGGGRGVGGRKEREGLPGPCERWGGVNIGCYALSLCYFLSLLRAGPSMSPITCTTTTIWNTVRSARIKTLAVLL
jgi:hypothetical protein